MNHLLLMKTKNLKIWMKSNWDQKNISCLAIIEAVVLIHAHGVLFTENLIVGRPIVKALPVPKFNVLPEITVQINRITKSSMSLKIKIKSVREPAYLSKDLDKAAEISLFYGFQPIKPQN